MGSEWARRACWTWLERSAEQLGREAETAAADALGAEDGLCCCAYSTRSCAANSTQPAAHLLHACLQGQEVDARAAVLWQPLARLV